MSFAARFNTIRKIRTFGVSILFLAGTLILLSSCASSGDEPAKPSATDGQLNLARYPFNDKRTVHLEGSWLFWPDRLLSTDEVRAEIANGYRQVTPVPGLWSKTGIFGSLSKLTKTGTLALELTLPADRHSWAIRLPNADTACELWVDGVKEGAVGTVGTTKKESIPNNGVCIIPYTSTSEKILLVLQVSNFHTPYTGTWDGPVFGTLRAITALRIASTAMTAVVSGALLFMGLYHLALYFFRRKDRNSLMFGIICLLLTVRNLIMGERILIDFFPATAMGWEIGFTIEHLSAHMTLPLFFVFFRQLYPRQIHKVAVGIVIAVSSVWGALELFTPALFHHRFLSLFEYFILVAAAYLLVELIRAFVRKEEGVRLVLAGFLVMLGAVINDVLLSNGIVHSFYMTSFGMFFFLFAQALLLSARYSQLFQTIEVYAEELGQINLSLERFLPHEMLRFLEKKSVVDIELGDVTERNMAVFFLDICDLGERCESMTPGETIRFLNSFLERVGPIVRRYGGFIDKYLGSGFIALFPGDSNQALDAALAIRDSMDVFNGMRRDEGEPIRIGIGIHRGPLMLGTIGENLRMDSTVISDTVNTASRLEQLAMKKGKTILVSTEMTRDLKDPGKYLLARIGKEKVKGKTRDIEVFELEGRAQEPAETRGE